VKGKEVKEEEKPVKKGPKGTNFIRKTEEEKEEFKVG
jgi:hypothetical protein